MKPLIIVDFSHICARMLYSAIVQIKPKKKNGQFITEEWSPYFKHLVFNSLQYTKNKFPGEIVIAMDGGNYWRKKIYPEYKQHRSKTRKESDINFNDYYREVDRIGEVLDDLFPFKVIKVDTVEADDIAGVLSYRFGNDRQVTLITSDHDWKQVIAESPLVKMWDPIKKVYQVLEEDEKTIIDTPYGKMSRFTIEHALLGDKGDNILSVTGKTEFSAPFLSFLKENEIYSSCVSEVQSMKVFDELVEKYNVMKTFKSGKNKGKPTEEKDIFKTVSFGIKSAKRISASKETLVDFLASHKMYEDRFILNKKLVDFMEIPLEIQDKIMDTYHSTEVHYDPNGILKYFMSERLEQMVMLANKFYDTSYQLKSSSSLDDFF